MKPDANKGDGLTSVWLASILGQVGKKGWGAGGAREKGCQGRKLSEVTNYAHRQDFFFLSEFSYLKISMASTQQ